MFRDWRKGIMKNPTVVNTPQPTGGSIAKWRPEGGERVAESLLVEVDELGPLDNPGSPQYEEYVKAEQEVAKLAVTNKLGVRLTDDSNEEPLTVSDETRAKLVELGRASIERANLDPEVLRRQLQDELRAAGGSENGP